MKFKASNDQEAYGEKLAGEQKTIDEWKSGLKARIRAAKLTDTELELIAKACLSVVEGEASGLSNEEWEELVVLGWLLS